MNAASLVHERGNSRAMAVIEGDRADCERRGSARKSRWSGSFTIQSDSRSILGQLAEVDAERAELAVEVRPLHADALGQLPDLAVAQDQLLLQVRALEMLACFAQRQRQQVLLHQRLVGRCVRSELAL